MLLDTICDSSFSDTARVASIRPGTLWGEAQCGTNALGTAAQSARRRHGPRRRALLRSPRTADLLGGAGVRSGRRAGRRARRSSDCRSRQQHTHALVSMAAVQIENGLFRECHRAHAVIAFHSRAEYLHTLSAGLLAVDRDGLVLAANARADFLLQGLPAVRGRRFEEIFRTSFGELLHAGGEEGCLRLEDRVGSAFAARLETLPRRRRMPAKPQAAECALPAGFVADDAAVATALRQVEAAAVRRLPILVRGGTGTGKEQLARHAHRASGRGGAFVAVNCASLPDALVEAELFGHADGAFTGARRGGAPGLVFESDGGTLFLDEIGDMKLSLQSVLLRLLDDWTVRPVGGGRRRVDVLLVAATNVDLQQAVAAGRFRADLLYRINTVEVTLPPLSRRTDFAAIARRLLSEVAPRASLSAAAAALLARRPWPGNVRELRSVLVRLTLADPSRVIDADAVSTPEDAPTGELAAAPHDLRVLLAERVRQVHVELGGTVTEAARQLGVSRNTAYRALRPPELRPSCITPS